MGDVRGVIEGLWGMLGDVRGCGGCGGMRGDIKGIGGRLTSFGIMESETFD